MHLPRLNVVALVAAVMVTRAGSTKYLWILRHGQAMHNPRAEVAMSNGCSHEEFLRLMQEDDSLDSDLTELGKEQARSVQLKYGHLVENVELAVSSPLSRALETANLAFPNPENRVVLENVREINGWLLNAKRRPKQQINEKFPDWKLENLIDEEDTWWTNELESQADCRERGYRAFSWILGRPEREIALICHGGLLRFTMQDHPLVVVEDSRSQGAGRTADERFTNCELRLYQISWKDEESNGRNSPTILLTEVDLDSLTNDA